jgi:hypothetical protein
MVNIIKAKGWENTLTVGKSQSKHYENVVIIQNVQNLNALDLRYDVMYTAITRSTKNIVIIQYGTRNIPNNTFWLNAGINSKITDIIRILKEKFFFYTHEAEKWLFEKMLKLTQKTWTMDEHHNVEMLKDFLMSELRAIKLDLLNGFANAKEAIYNLKDEFEWSIMIAKDEITEKISAIVRSITQSEMVAIMSMKMIDAASLINDLKDWIDDIKIEINTRIKEKRMTNIEAKTLYKNVASVKKRLRKESIEPMGIEMQDFSSIDVLESMIDKFDDALELKQDDNIITKAIHNVTEKIRNLVFKIRSKTKKLKSKIDAMKNQLIIATHIKIEEMEKMIEDKSVIQSIITKCADVNNLIAQKLATNISKLNRIIEKLIMDKLQAFYNAKTPLIEIHNYASEIEITCQQLRTLHTHHMDKGNAIDAVENMIKISGQLLKHYQQYYPDLELQWHYQTMLYNQFYASKNVKLTTLDYSLVVMAKSITSNIPPITEDLKFLVDDIGPMIDGLTNLTSSQFVRMCLFLQEKLNESWETKQSHSAKEDIIKQILQLTEIEYLVESEFAEDKWLSVRRQLVRLSKLTSINIKLWWQEQKNKDSFTGLLSRMLNKIVKGLEEFVASMKNASRALISNVLILLNSSELSNDELMTMKNEIQKDKSEMLTAFIALKGDIAEKLKGAKYFIIVMLDALTDIISGMIVETKERITLPQQITRKWNMMLICNNLFSNPFKSAKFFNIYNNINCMRATGKIPDVEDIDNLFIHYNARIRRNLIDKIKEYMSFELSTNYFFINSINIECITMIYYISQRMSRRNYEHIAEMIDNYDKQIEKEEITQVMTPDILTMLNVWNKNPEKLISFYCNKDKLHVEFIEKSKTNIYRMKVEIETSGIFTMLDTNATINVATCLMKTTKHTMKKVSSKIIKLYNEMVDKYDRNRIATYSHQLTSGGNVYENMSDVASCVNLSMLKILISMDKIEDVSINYRCTAIRYQGKIMFVHCSLNKLNIIHHVKLISSEKLGKILQDVSMIINASEGFYVFTEYAENNLSDETLNVEENFIISEKENDEIILKEKNEHNE